MLLKTNIQLLRDKNTYLFIYLFIHGSFQTLNTSTAQKLAPVG